MKIFAIWFGITLSNMAFCQTKMSPRVIKYDSRDRLVTTFSRNNSSYTYLGSPYFGDSIWHQGSLIYRNQKEVPAQIAYNLVFDLVYWRLSDSKETSPILPDEFTIDGHRFVSKQRKPLGVEHVSYYEILYDGKTKLLRRWIKKLKFIDRKSYSIRVAFDDMFDGEYIQSEDFYIQKQGEQPHYITPDEYALSSVLPNMGSDLANFIAAHKLTEKILIEVVARYDNRFTNR